ncbi:hypothetical protein E8E12_006450 [Didymella heteroderae]|uniref:Uncharacterized protein n=1 Tax=Didymella heteroderae TaxID=1769908 RepID=A0A9P4WMJ7_9PLEO|nr:hypothetical protein E8E12_006450 [Didymella heteroderae]
MVASRLATRAQQPPSQVQPHAHARTTTADVLATCSPVSALFLTRPPVLDALQQRIVLGAADHRSIATSLHRYIVRPAPFFKAALPAVSLPAVPELSHLAHATAPPSPSARSPQSLPSPVEHLYGPRSPSPADSLSVSLSHPPTLSSPLARLAALCLHRPVAAIAPLETSRIPVYGDPLCAIHQPSPAAD